MIRCESSLNNVSIESCHDFYFTDPMYESNHWTLYLKKKKKIDLLGMSAQFIYTVKLSDTLKNLNFIA